MSAHVWTQTHAHIRTLVFMAHTQRGKKSQGELEQEKKKALINCCLTLLDRDGPVHKSEFYGLYSVHNPLAFSLWFPLPSQQSQDPKWPAPWRQLHPLTVWKNNTKIHWKHHDLYSIKPLTHCELCKNRLSTACDTCLRPHISRFGLWQLHKFNKGCSFMWVIYRLH